MKEQIKQALEKASTQHEWDTDGRSITWKDGHPLKGTYRQIAITHAPVSESFNNENHENDAHLIANAPEWLRYLISEAERKDKEITELRERINGELEVSEQVVQEREELILENEQMNEALKNIRTHYVSVHDEDWKKAYDEIWNMAFPPKEGERK